MSWILSNNLFFPGTYGSILIAGSAGLPSVLARVVSVVATALPPNKLPPAAGAGAVAVVPVEPVAVEVDPNRLLVPASVLEPPNKFVVAAGAGAGAVAGAAAGPAAGAGVEVPNKFEVASAGALVLAPKVVSPNKLPVAGAGAAFAFAGAGAGVAVAAGAGAGVPNILLVSPPPKRLEDPPAAAGAGVPNKFAVPPGAGAGAGPGAGAANGVLPKIFEESAAAGAAPNILAPPAGAGVPNRLAVPAPPGAGVPKMLSMVLLDQLALLLKFSRSLRVQCSD